MNDETSEQLAERVRASIGYPWNVGLTKREALVALDTLLGRLDVAMKERDEQRRLADSAFGKAEQYREAAVLAEQIQRDAETAAVVARSNLAGYKQLLEDSQAETEALAHALEQIGDAKLLADGDFGHELRARQDLARAALAARSK